MTVEQRLRELARRHGLSDGTLAALRALLDHLANAPAAPSTVTDPARAVDVHVADSLAGLEVPALRQARRIADLGAGAGYPGLVLAAARPEAQVTLVESVGKKAVFIAEAAAAAGLANAEALASRVELWAEGRGDCEAVTARALAALPVLLEYAAPLLTLGGHLVAWKGARDAEEEAAAAIAASELGLAPLDILPVQPFPAARHRHLHVFVKAAATPERFPRRAGMAAKRPLGGAAPLSPPVRPVASRPWAPSSRSPTRRVGSGRPPRP